MSQAGVGAGFAVEEGGLRSPGTGSNNPSDDGISTPLQNTYTNKPDSSIYIQLYL